MSCRELAALRAEAQELNRQLVHQRAVARSTAHLERGTHASGKSDFEPLLKRKLDRLAQTIQKHKSEHGCED
jgi:predicted transcriptional regulator